MPTARVQTPDGRVMVLQVPDGATNEQIQAFAASQFNGGLSVDEQAQPESPQQAGGGRSGRSRRLVAKRNETQDLLQQIESGQITSQDLTPAQIEGVRLARIEALPEVTEGISDKVDIGTAATLLTTTNPLEFAQILQQKDPDISIQHTPEGNVLVHNKSRGQTAQINKDGFSAIDAFQTAGIISAFAPSARLAASAPALASKLIGRQAASPTGIKAIAGVLGAGATEAISQSAQEQAGGTFDEGQVALAAGLGGAAEIAIPAAQATGRAVKRAVGGAEETAEQAARRAILEAEGLAPTRAQVTRDAGEFQTQQELSKVSSPVRSRLEQQEARLQGAFEQRAIDTKGNIVTSTSTPVDEILERSISLDEQIGQLYSQARQVAPDAKNIRLQGLATNLKKISGEENISGGLVSSVKSNLKNRGIINADGNIAGRVSVETAEQVRQDINLLFDSVSDRGRQLSRELKDSLDGDVLRQSGGDLFEQARLAKSNFEKGLNRAKISKFDKRKNSLVRDILDNKISPDNFVNDVVFAKKWRAEDINQLKSYLNQTKSGKQAWSDIRAQAIDKIKEDAFKGPVRSDGVTQSLSRAALESSLKKIDKKLPVLFDSGERRFLDRMVEVSKLREPPPATFQGKGPSAQAVNEIKNRFPIIGPIFESLSNFKQNRLLLSLPRRASTGRQRNIIAPTESAQLLREEE